ncbi:MAG TPA: serine/threonine-protein kinase [Candidatus Saccharimonadales bacterium]|nr:serine/threonine-protein kinase [Candidatus Saccharimonadales bacterium]
MSNGVPSSSKPLKMVTCGRCKSKTFISGDLPPFATEPCKKCQHPLLLPVMLRNFEIRTIIASGGMGTVYTAHDVKLEREIALKMMKREMAADPEIMQAFYREARAGASLNHTNIIHVYSFDEFEGQPYLVMELADQGSLDNRIEMENRVPELDILDVGIKVASALAAALKHNLLHRDIKPGNILYNIDGEPKLIDFGLVRAAETENTWEEHVWGTIYYVAPEKIERKGEDFHSDMYSLGGTLYHAITGHAPFEGTVDEVVAAHVHTPLTPPNQVVPEITEATSNALVRAMAKRPADRFETYDEFQMELEAARSQLLMQQVREAGQVAPAKSWWRKKK